MKELTKLAKNIKKYRKKLNISQDKLAKLSGLAYNTIAKIEISEITNPTIDTLKKIAKALKVKVSDLLEE